tara:strand:- start:10980 stop:11525 length:546 start_codon:yes stop_codon:yes gene_type:complete
MDGLNTWDVATPTVYQTFGEAVNAFARNIYKGWIWRLESVAEYGDLSDEEINAMSNFREWVYYGNDVSNSGAFQLFIPRVPLPEEIRNTLLNILENEVFQASKFYQNGSLIPTSGMNEVIPVELQQELTDLDSEIETHLEKEGNLAPYKSILILSLGLNYYDGYETDEQCSFRIYRIGGSQ